MRQKINLNKDVLLGAIVFIAVTVLIIDRVVHNSLVAPITTLGDYLKRTNKMALLERQPKDSPFDELTPRWQQCETDTAYTLPSRPAFAYHLHLHPQASQELLAQLQNLLTDLNGKHRPLHLFLSDTFVELNRFIQTRKNLDRVEDALKAFTEKTKKQPLTLSSEWMSALDTFDKNFEKVRCHWHQQNPYSSSWTLHRSRALEPLFPPRASQQLNLAAAEEYFDLATTSAFPLWYQQESPSDDIRTRFDVKTRPSPPALPALERLQELHAFLKRAGAPTGQTVKTVAWQLKNITGLIDRAARLTPPDANLAFGESVTQLNDRLNQIGDSDKDRWTALAWDLASMDLHVADQLRSLALKKYFRYAPDSLEDLQSEWDGFFRAPFNATTYWIFPKEPLSIKQRLEETLLALSKNPSISVSPETPWAYWWVHGRFLERSRSLFKFRQLLLGLLVGMTLVLWTLKRLYSS